MRKREEKMVEGVSRPGGSQPIQPHIPVEEQQISLIKELAQSITDKMPAIANQINIPEKD